MVGLGRMPTRELPHYWTPEQVRQILAAMPAGRPWLFALLLWRSALRQAEALDLQWRDLNFAAAAADHHGEEKQRQQGTNKRQPRIKRVKFTGSYSKFQ